MAQKTEKEETEFKVPAETLALCVKNCGFTGNPTTNNMCQKCFNIASSSSSPTGPILVPTSQKESTSRSATSRSPRRVLSQPRQIITRDLNLLDRTAQGETQTSEPKSIPHREVKLVNRCSGCRRKVGLTGFRCRCGELFCAEHRYSDRHDCSYDYKTAGREAIIRENPIVKAAKIVKI